MTTKTNDRRPPTADELRGMCWWNALSRRERHEVLTAANLCHGRMASVADAWRLRKAGRL